MLTDKTKMMETTISRQRQQRDPKSDGLEAELHHSKLDVNALKRLLRIPSLLPFLCFVLFCFVLFCFVLFCFVLFCFVLFCFVLFCFVLFCFVLFRRVSLKAAP